MPGDPIDRLSEGQRACLRMVLRHMSSKDIARELSLSPHTIDQRIRLAMRAVGAGSRIEAARRLAAAEGEGEYQGLIYQPPYIDPDATDRTLAAPAADAQRREVRNADRLPKIAWIMLVAAAAAMAFAGVFVGLNALAEFTR